MSFQTRQQTPLLLPRLGPTQLLEIGDELDVQNGAVLGGGIGGEIPDVISDDDVTLETMTDSSNVSAKQCINEVSLHFSSPQLCFTFKICVQFL